MTFVMGMRMIEFTWRWNVSVERRWAMVCVVLGAGMKIEGGLVGLDSWMAFGLLMIVMTVMLRVRDLLLLPLLVRWTRPPSPSPLRARVETMLLIIVLEPGKLLVDWRTEAVAVFGSREMTPVMHRRKRVRKSEERGNRMNESEDVAHDTVRTGRTMAGMLRVDKLRMVEMVPVPLMRTRSIVHTVHVWVAVIAFWIKLQTLTIGFGVEVRMVILPFVWFVLLVRRVTVGTRVFFVMRGMMRMMFFVLV